jgi:DNA-binding NarL/FixJ family response regulator
VMGFAGAADNDPRRRSARAALALLSPGERDVALLVAQGRTNQEIGTALRMSTATVKAYVSRILTKLDLTNRVQVAIVVHDAGEPPGGPRSLT